MCDIENMTIGERIKYIRKSPNIDLTLEKFGERLGVKKNTMSAIENNRNSATEQMIRSICREFNVNYPFLMEGIGDMFSNLPETILDEVVDEFDLDELDKLIVQRYMQLSKEKRAIIKEYLQSVFIYEKSE